MTPQGAGRRPHIVDTLIEERAPRLRRSPLWPILRAGLYPALGYRRARRMADALAALSGRQALDHVSDLLSLQVESVGADRIPAAGRLVVAINHPTGLADGVAAFDLLKGPRPDLVFFANADALRVCPRLDEAVIPVEWVAAKRSREKTRDTLARAVAALQAERALVIAPAGRIARGAERGLPVDPPWQSAACALARRHGAPILPVHMTGPPPTLFRLFNRLSPELRDITLFHELLNKRGRRFRLTVGRTIPAARIDADVAAFTKRLKTYIERVLPVHPDAPFP